MSNPSPLNGTNIVIFGGSSGIGLATAVAANQQGAMVTIVGRSPVKLETAAAGLNRAHTVVANITNRESVTAVFDGMTRVDHLVITSGTLGGGKLADTDPDELLRSVQERIAGPLYAIKTAMPLMPATGSIVLMGGQYSDRPSGDGVAVVSAAVRAVEALARSLALELQTHSGQRDCTGPR